MEALAGVGRGDTAGQRGMAETAVLLPSPTASPEWVLGCMHAPLEHTRWAVQDGQPGTCNVSCP